MTAFGIDPLMAYQGLRGVPSVVANAVRYVGSAETDSRFPLRFRNIHPCPADRFQEAGSIKNHYFHQDLWAARLVHGRQPDEHCDVGSRIDGFVAHLLAFLPVKVIDIRPLDESVHGLIFLRGDILRMPQADDSVASLSCLHALEHVGLGRYGDPVDPLGWRKALLELQRVLAMEGRLYLGVPIGRERLCFDAHRVFSPNTIFETADALDLVSFAYIDDDGKFHDNQDPLSLPEMEYGCGLFEFTKPRHQLA